MILQTHSQTLLGKRLLIHAMINNSVSKRDLFIKVASLLE